MTWIACETADRRSAVSEVEGLRITDSPSRSDWDAYLDRRGVGTFFHRSAWERVFDVYRLPLLRLAAVRGERIVGVLPLIHQKSWPFGNHFVSLPWFDAAGVLADSDEARRMLVDEAMRRASAAGASEVEVRQYDACNLSPRVRSDKMLMRLRLEQASDRLWKRLKPKVRNQVRKAENSGLSVVTGGPELLADFHAIYSRNMRDLGSPSHSLRFFEAIVASFTRQTRLHVVRQGSVAVGCGMTFLDGDRVEIPWASSLRKYNSLCVNHLMYWHLLSDACERGLRWFHFGRSTRGSGTYDFKKQWGAEEAPLHWYRLGTDADEPLIGDSFGWAIAVWRRLPLCVARRLGPRVIAKVA